MQELPKLHRNFFSGFFIWGSVRPTEENILLLNNIEVSNQTAVYKLNPTANEFQVNLRNLRILSLVPGKKNLGHKFKKKKIITGGLHIGREEKVVL